jgi:hypothetical protein
MNVAGLSFGPVGGGPLAGLLTINIEFANTGTDITGPDLMEKIVNYATGPRPMICIRGEYATKAENEISGFVRALKSWPFFVQVDTDGRVIPPWLDAVDYIRVYLGNEPWLMHNCHEVRLLYDGKTPEPMLPPKSNPACYVQFSDESLWEPALRFCQKSKHRWGMIYMAGPTRTISI